MREQFLAEGQEHSSFDVEYCIKLAQDSIRRQDWENDKAFLRSLNRGKEKGFPTLDDFRTKRDTTYVYFAARHNKGKREGERSSRKFALAGSWKRLQPALWIIFGIIMMFYAIKTRVFFPDNGESYLIMKPTPVAVVIPTPIAATIGGQSPLSDRIGDDIRLLRRVSGGSGVFSNELGPLVGLIQYAVMGTGGIVALIVLSGVFRRKKTPISIPDTIRVIHESAPE